MSNQKESEVLHLLHPSLLSKEDLIDQIQSRCQVQNLNCMSKEGLVEIFRRIILPLPQRLYRTNRRGKMLLMRRTKRGLEKSKKEGQRERISLSNKDQKRDSDLDRIVINDRRKSNKNEDREEKGRIEEKRQKIDVSTSSKKIILKRSSDSTYENSNSSSSSHSTRKKQRTSIKWP